MKTNERAATPAAPHDPKRSEKAQHTPGPWTLPEHGDGVLVSGPDKRRVALTAIESDGMFVGRNIREARANARLIAQAPAMYELLRAVVHEFDESDPTRSTFTGNFPDVINDAKAILAAIDGSES